MSKRSDRREAERQARKTAYQASRAQQSAAEKLVQAHVERVESAKDAAARHQSGKELAIPLGGALDTATVLRDFRNTLEDEDALVTEEADLLARAQAFFQRPEPVAAAEPITEPLVEPLTEPKPLSEAQLAANRANAQLSTGPVTEEGRAISSQNRRTHGLTGRFVLLPFEEQSEYDKLAQSIYTEHHPQSDTEQRLADAMIRYQWLMQRALYLQDELLLRSEDPLNVDAKRFSLFVRYHNTHEKSYYKALRELRHIQKERHKETNGFESQTQKQEAHEARVRLANARALNLEVDSACRQVMEIPLPGNTTLSFEELTKACTTGISVAISRKQRELAAKAA